MGHSTSFVFVSLILSVFVASEALAQTTQYQRKKKAAPTAEQVPAAGAAAPGAKPTDPNAAPKSEKLDVTGLEEKYWSSQDTDFTVVQNRTYTKVGKVSASLSLGMPANDSYNAGFFNTLAVNYYWSERMCVELSYSSFDLKDSKLVENFLGQSGGTRPDMTRDKSAIGASYNWIPIYAKASLLGNKIMYFDFAVSPGISMVTYEQFVDTGNKTDSALALTLDFSQQFFLSKEWAVRFDFKNRWGAQKVLGYSGAGRGVEKRNDPIYSSFLVFGLTYFF